MALTRRGFLGTLVALAATAGLPDLPVAFPLQVARARGYDIGKTCRVRLPQRYEVRAGMEYTPVAIVDVYRDAEAME